VKEIDETKISTDTYNFIKEKASDNKINVAESQTRDITNVSESQTKGKRDFIDVKESVNSIQSDKEAYVQKEDEHPQKVILNQNGDDLNQKNKGFNIMPAIVEGFFAVK